VLETVALVYSADSKSGERSVKMISERVISS